MNVCMCVSVCERDFERNTIENNKGHKAHSNVSFLEFKWWIHLISRQIHSIYNANTNQGT